MYFSRLEGLIERHGVVLVGYRGVVRSRREKKPVNL